MRVLPVNVRKDRADYLYIGASILIALATFVLAGTALIQARAARTTADVARAQVQAIIGENRPWLLLEWDENGSSRIQDPYLMPVGTMPRGQERFSNCIFFVRNYGQTPARLLALSAGLQIGESPAQPPSSEIREIGNRYSPLIFPQGGTLAQVAELATGIIAGRELDDVRNGRKFLWLRATLTYRHTTEIPGIPNYETQFCYVWETRMNTPTPFWRLAGPVEYNRAT